MKEILSGSKNAVILMRKGGVFLIIIIIIIVLLYPALGKMEELLLDMKPDVGKISVELSKFLSSCSHSSRSIIHSDEWRAYSRVANIPAVASHSMVNHSITFVDPTTGAHTQHIESYWNQVKLKLKQMKGCHFDQIPINSCGWSDMDRHHTWHG